MPEHKRARAIGRLFQDPLKGTAPNMTISKKKSRFAHIVVGNVHWAIKKKDRRFFYRKAISTHLGLEERLKTKVGLLSGGQRQALTLLIATPSNAEAAFR